MTTTDPAILEQVKHLRGPERATALKGHERQEALKSDAIDKRELVRSSLEHAALNIVALDPAQVAISQAISLKRIADAMQPVNVKATPDELAMRLYIEHHQGKSQTIESLAGDMLNLTPAEIEGLGLGGATTMAKNIRRLASAVLRKAEK